MLVETAAFSEALRAFGASKRRLSEIGLKVGGDVIEGVKLTL